MGAAGGGRAAAFAADRELLALEVRQPSPKPATLCDPACHRMCFGLQPYVPQPATLFCPQVRTLTQALAEHQASVSAPSPPKRDSR